MENKTSNWRDALNGKSGATRWLIALALIGAVVAILIVSGDETDGEGPAPFVPTDQNGSVEQVEPPQSGGLAPGEDSSTDGPSTGGISEGPSEPDQGGPYAAPIGGEEGEAIADVLRQIESGQQLPYYQDGQTFQNREGRLPDQPLGYYREYTVETPGSPDRGARRLVIGEAGETYYTDDHYGSFVLIDPEDYL